MANRFLESDVSRNRFLEPEQSETPSNRFLVEEPTAKTNRFLETEPTEPETGFMQNLSTGIARGAEAMLPPPLSTVFREGVPKGPERGGTWETGKSEPLSPEYTRTGEQIKESLMKAGLGEEEPAEAHPFEDPVRLALLFGIPGMAGKSLLAKLGSGVGFNVGYETLDKLLTEGRLPTKGEYGWATLAGTLPAGLNVAFKGVGRGLKAVFRKGVEDIARKTGESGPDVINRILQRVEQEGVSANRVISEELTGLGEGAKEFNDLWERNVQESIDASFPKYAGSINLQRQAVSPEAKTLIQEAGEAAGKTPRPHAELVKEAKQAEGWGINDVLRIEDPTALDDVHKFRLRQIVANEAETLAKLKKSQNVPDEMLNSRMADFMEAVKKDAKVASTLGQEMGQRAITIFPEDSFMDAKIKAFRNLTKSKNAADRDWVTRHVNMILDAEDPNVIKGILYDALASKTRKVTDAVETAIVNFFLSSPTTWLKVHLSQGLFTAERPFLQRPVAAGIDSFLSFVRGTQRERYLSDAIVDVKAMTDALPDAARYFARSAKAGRQIFTEEVLGKEFIPRAGFGKGPVGKAAGRILQFPGAIGIGAGDDALKVLNYRAEIAVDAHRQALRAGLRGEEYADFVANLIAKPTKLMKERAAEEAFEKAMQRKLSKMGEAVRYLRDSLPIGGKMINPFITVADSTIKSVYDRTPVALPELIYKFGTGKMGQGPFADRMSKVVIGSILAGGIYTLAQKNMVTGGPPVNKKDRDVWYATGRKPYHFLAPNGEQYPYGWAEPVATIIGTIADYHGIREYADENDSPWKLAYYPFARNILNKSWMEGLSNFFETVMDPQMTGEGLEKQLAGSLVPQISYRIAGVIDPTLRDPRNLEEAFKKRIPGLSEEVPPIRDIWGKPVMDLGNPISKMINPARIRELEDDPVTNAVFEAKAQISSPTQNIGKIPMTLEEHELLLERKGAISHQLIGKYIGSVDYANATPQERKERIEKIDSKVNELARKWIEKKVYTRLRGQGYSTKEYIGFKKERLPLPEEVRQQGR